MQRLKVSGAVRHVYRSLGVKGVTRHTANLFNTLNYPLHNIGILDRDVQLFTKYLEIVAT
jgi:hypothetical protein